MKLSLIEAKNLKGSTFNQPLSDITLFYGENAAGKTTRVDALTLALTKSLPGIATRPSDIHDLLASDAELTVYTETDAQLPEFAGCSWTKGRKGIETTFEGSLEAPRLLFSTSEFLDLTAKERTKFLFGILPPPPLDKVGPEAITARLKNIKLEPHTEHAEKAITDLCHTVDESWTRATATKQGCTVQEWLGVLVEEITEHVKTIKANLKAMKATSLGITAMRKEAPSMAPVELRRRKAQETLQLAVAAEQDALNKFTDAERKVQEAKVMAAKWVDPTEAQAQIAELESSVTELLKVQPSGLPPTLGVMTARPSEISVRNKLREASNATDQALLKHDRCKADVLQIQKQIADAKQQTCCPTCGHDISEKQAEIVASLTLRLTAANLDLENLEKQLKQAQEAEDSVKAEVMAMVKAIERWEADKSAMDHANQEQLNKHNAAVRAFNDSRTIINGNQARIAILQKAIESNATAEAAKAILPDLETASARAAEAYRNIGVHNASIKATMDSVEAEYRTALADAAAARNIQQAINEVERLEAEVGVGEETKEMLVELLNESIKLSIGPLVTLANNLCADILKAPLVFEDGEIRMATRTGGHSHRTFSGTERALAYAALSVGLATQSPVKLVIFDELGRLSKKNKLKLVCRLAKLIAEKTIDQAVLVDTEPLEELAQGIEGVGFSQVEVK